MDENDKSNTKESLAKETNIEYKEIINTLLRSEKLSDEQKVFLNSIEIDPRLLSSDNHLTYHEKIQQIKNNYSRAYLPWDEKEEEVLKQFYLEELNKNILSQSKIIKQLAKEFYRQPGAIRSRLKKLGLIKM